MYFRYTMTVARQQSLECPVAQNLLAHNLRWQGGLMFILFCTGVAVAI